MRDNAEHHQLRRAWLRGYRLADVELYVARSTLSLEQLQHELEASRQRTHAMQSEINDLHNRVDSFRRREAELDRELAELREQRAALQREASDRSEAIVAEAEQRATALRTEGLRQVGELQRQVEQLLGMRAGLSQALQAAIDGVSAALEEIRAAPARAVEPEPEPETEAAPEPARDDFDDQLARWTGEPGA
jgi:predicted  nucleic acid-binding Zn-ribbon protein